MKPLKVALIAAASASTLLFVVLLLLCWTNWPRRVQGHRPKHQENIRSPAKLHPDGSDENDDVVSKTSKGQPFEWKKHPCLMADAFDRGWTAFALSYTSVASVSPLRWKLCSTGGSIDEGFLPEVAWGMTKPGTDLVQLIRLNPGASIQETFLASIQTLHSALPLPGPFTEQSSFPQEAYFELTILSEGTQKSNFFSFNKYGDDDRTILIPQNISSSCIIECITECAYFEGEGEGEANSEDTGGVLEKLIEKGGKQIDPQMEDSAKNLQSTEETTKEEMRIIAVGLTAKDAPSFHLPGTYWGSVGFQSNGKIMLNGTPCQQGFTTFEATVNTTLGCGFHPSSQKIYFTINGELVAEIFGTKSEFGQPLYVAVGSNYDTTIMVNFGQGPFVYEAANDKRVEDPICQTEPPPKFIKSRENSTDLFSMRMAGSPLPQGIDTPSLKATQHTNAISTTDSDFFEIALEGVV